VSFAVRAYQPGDEEQILALFRRVFGQPREMAHWRWKFAANPAGSQIVLAVADDGRIVGQFAGLPADAVSPTGPFVLSQGVDHMVDPEFQKRGVFAAMTRHFAQRFLPPARDVVFYSYPLAHKHSIDQRIGDAQLVHAVRAVRFDLGGAEPWRATRTWETWRHRVRRVDRFPASVDRLWQRALRPEAGVSIVKNRRYLDWRYADCPDVAYLRLVVESRLTGRALGVAVLRLGWFAEPIAPLLELLVPVRERAALRLLLGACHDLAREQGLWSVKAWLPHGTALHDAVTELGYVDEETPFLLTQMADPDRARAAAMRARWSYAMGDSDVY
jgi:hypothetical protein